MKVRFKKNGPDVYSDYKIKDRTIKKANNLGVMVYPSTNPQKKIDVHSSSGEFLARIGDIEYMDYPSYLATAGKDTANNRRKLYKIRHNKDRHKVGTPSFFADQLLWS
tara:strand:+ start:5967 stop:6290 length:324 start_codon:yes stop_codon:yes gene_type:complete